MIETALNYLLILWALPSLVTALLLIRASRNYKVPYEPSGYDLDDWGVFFALSILYPAGLWFVLMEWLDNE